MAHGEVKGYDGEVVCGEVRRSAVIGFDHGYVRVLGAGKETTAFIMNIAFPATAPYADEVP